MGRDHQLLHLYINIQQDMAVLKGKQAALPAEQQQSGQQQSGLQHVQQSHSSSILRHRSSSHEDSVDGQDSTDGGLAASPPSTAADAKPGESRVRNMTQCLASCTVKACCCCCFKKKKKEKVEGMAYNYIHKLQA